MSKRPPSILKSPTAKSNTRKVPEEYLRRQLPTSSAQISHEGHFQNTYIKDYSNYQQVNLQQVKNDELRLKSANTILIAYELRVTKNNKSASLTYNTKNFASSTSSSTKKSFRGNTSAGINTKNYDRIIFLGDILSTTGDMFVVIADQLATSNKLFFNVHHHPIGNLIGIVEPEFEGKYLGNTDTLPIMITKKPFLSCHELPHHMKQRFNRIPVNIPDTSCFQYFFLTQESIVLNNITMEKACCSGYLCDRQEKYHKSNKCGSLEKGNPHSVQANVMESHIYVMKKDEEPTVYQLQMRSFTFSCLFLSQSILQLPLHNFLRLESLVREHVHNMVKYVNENGGWNLLGWFKTASADVDEKPEGTEIAVGTIPHLHFVLIEPTKDECHQHLRKNLFLFPSVENTDQLLLESETNE